MSAAGAVAAAGAAAGDHVRRRLQDVGGTIMIVIAFSLLLALLLAVLTARWARRWWANRAHSMKVLDEIEMEFVDDIDDDLELLRSSGDGTPSRLPHSGDAAWAAPSHAEQHELPDDR